MGLAPDPSGHWVEHLSSVGLKLTQAMLLVGLACLLGTRRLGPPLIVVLVALVTGIALQSYGDL